MNELVDRAAQLFPAYFRDLLALVNGPKRFVITRVGAKAGLEKALVFLAISVGINWLLKLPLSPVDVISAMQAAAFSLVLWTSAGGVIWLACRAAGGTGALDRTLASSFYYFGVLEYVMSLTALSYMGALRAIDPALYREFVKALYEGRFYAFAMDTDRLLMSAGFFVSTGIVLLGAMAALLWMVAGWGGFRSVHALGRFRSTLAFAIAIVLSLPLLALIGLLANALVPAPS
jgi:hypothetical protein